MSWSLVITLCLIWVLGVGTGHMMGGFVHAFLFAALAGVGLRFARARRAAPARQPPRRGSYREFIRRK